MFKYCRCGDKIDISKKYCDKCKVVQDVMSKARYRDYRAKRTDIKEQKFYNSNEWIKARDKAKLRDKGLCLYSYYILGIFVVADCVHHIVELKEDYNLRCDLDNLICVSDEVHKMIHNEYKKGKVAKDNIKKILKEIVEGSGLK